MLGLPNTMCYLWMLWSTSPSTGGHGLNGSGYQGSNSLHYLTSIINCCTKLATSSHGISSKLHELESKNEDSTRNVHRYFSIFLLTFELLFCEVFQWCIFYNKQFWFFVLSVVLTLQHWLIFFNFHYLNRKFCLRFKLN